MQREPRVSPGMNANDLTPSEVIVLCGERFVDQVRSTDSSSERTLYGQQTVNAERLAVAVIRAAILCNQAVKVTTLTWRAATELKSELEPLTASAGLLGNFMRSAFVQSALDQPVPHLEPGPSQHHWPAKTIEALLAEVDPLQVAAKIKPARSAREKVLTGLHPSSSVTALLETKLALHGGDGLIYHIKEGMAERGLLERFQRGFGLLVKGFKLPEATRRLVAAQLPTLEQALQDVQRDDPRTWNGLEEAITRAMRRND